MRPSRAYFGESGESSEMSTQEIQTQKPTNGKARASLVCSLVGLLCCGPFLFAGLVLGTDAQNQIRKSNGTQGGEGLAKAGVMIGLIGLMIWGFGLLIMLAAHSGG